MTSRSKPMRLPVCDVCANSITLGADDATITAVWGTEQKPDDKRAWCWDCSAYNPWHFVERHDITEAGDDFGK